MRGRTIAAAVIGVVLVASAAEAAAARPRHRPAGINAREHRQAERIRNGVANELTRRELDRLRADEAAIRAEKRVYRAKHNNREPQ